MILKIHSLGEFWWFLQILNFKGPKSFVASAISRIQAEGIPALTVLERLKSGRSQVALVVDEYGELQGLVTLNDILEAIVGDISSTDGWARPEAVRREDGSWLVDGMLPIDELKGIFQVKELPLPEEEEGHYWTLGGFVRELISQNSIRPRQSALPTNGVRRICDLRPPV